MIGKRKCGRTCLDVQHVTWVRSFVHDEVILSHVNLRKLGFYRLTRGPVDFIENNNQHISGNE